MKEKYLLFKDDIISEDRLIKFFNNQKYKVIYETDDYYVLPSQNNQECGIGKECENTKYEIIEIDTN